MKDSELEEINEDLGTVRVYINEHNGKLTDSATLGELQTAVAILADVVQRLAAAMIKERGE